MKRIKAACLEQTVHFMLKDGLSPAVAKQEVRQEYERYKAQLEHTRTKFRILEETEQPDGSILIRIKKQYNGQPVGDYFD